MSRTKYVMAEAEVEVSLTEWTTSELLEEINQRGGVGEGEKPIYEGLYIAIVTGDDERRDHLLRLLIYKAIGRILP